MKECEVVESTGESAELEKASGGTLPEDVETPENPESIETPVTEPDMVVESGEWMAEELDSTKSVDSTGFAENAEDTVEQLKGVRQEEEQDVEVTLDEDDRILIRYPDTEAVYRVLESATPLDYWRDTAEKLINDPDSYTLHVVEKTKTEDGRPLPEVHPPLLVVLEVWKTRPVEKFWRRIFFERA